MSQRRWVVRRHVGHSDRLVVLPDQPGAPTPRSGDYDDYMRRQVPPASSEPELTIEARFIPETEKRTCPVCARKVRFNLRQQRFYSHSLPDSTRNCRQSGR
jgi:hypothetical protein